MNTKLDKCMKKIDVYDLTRISNCLMATSSWIFHTIGLTGASFSKALTFKCVIN